MSVPLVQQIRVGAYVLKQQFKRVDRYPLVLMLEPLFLSEVFLEELSERLLNLKHALIVVKRKLKLH